MFIFCFSDTQTLVKQVQRDDNIRILLEAIQHAFELTKVAEALREMEPETKQVNILQDMLQRVSECAEFIESYARDVQAGTSS